VSRVFAGDLLDMNSDDFDFGAGVFETGEANMDILGFDRFR
jgi:hypothetical protein